MNGVREKCIQLRKEGKTLPEIIRETRTPKTTVYGYIRNIPLSQKKKRDISIAAGKRIQKHTLARKGVAKKPIKPFRNWTKERILLVAHLCFDGEISHRGCFYNNRSVALIKRVTTLMKGVYDFDPIFYKNPKTQVLRVSYNNVELAFFLKKRAQELFSKIKTLPMEYKKEILRAFFDDEGCIDFRPNTNIRRVRGYQKDVKILTVIQTLLLDFEIKARVQKPNEVVITGKENLQKFKKEIDFSKGVYMNGERKNSRWKKNIEKRKLLSQAIKSFKD